MIRKLRIKFILIAMISVLTVLAILIGGINIINYNRVMDNADDMLDELADNGGAFPGRDQDFEPEWSTPEDDNAMPAPDGESVAPPDGESDILPPSAEMMPQPMREEMFASRYFSVLIDDNGQIVQTDTGSIFEVSSDEAGEYAEEVIDRGDTRGVYKGYRFLCADEDAGTRVIFYDISRDMDSFRSFRNTSILISAAGMLLVFALLLPLSELITGPASESYEKQKRFITDAGHEIKTPLAIISADAEVLAADVGEDNEWITDIRGQVKSLTGLTDDLVYLSRMEESRTEVIRETVDLSSLLIEKADQFRSRAAAGGIDYRRDIAPEVSCTGNRSDIERICSVLLDNAMKYTPEGGCVEVTLQRRDRNAAITVSNDTGEELSEENVRHVFERFYRADASRNSQTGGHGLGLAVARAAAERSGGRISAAKSDDGRFVITVVFNVR